MQFYGGCPKCFLTVNSLQHKQTQRKRTRLIYIYLKRMNFVLQQAILQQRIIIAYNRYNWMPNHCTYQRTDPTLVCNTPQRSFHKNLCFFAERLHVIQETDWERLQQCQHCFQLSVLFEFMFVGCAIRAGVCGAWSTIKAIVCRTDRSKLTEPTFPSLLFWSVTGFSFPQPELKTTMNLILEPIRVKGKVIFAKQ